MKTSISRRRIIVATICSALSGAVAFAEEDGAAARASSAPRSIHSGGHVAPVYKATAPRFTGSSAVRHPSTQPSTGARTFTKTPGTPQRRPVPFAEQKTTPRVVRPHRPSTPGFHKGGEGAANWSHSNFSGKSKLDQQSAARLRDWRGKTDNFAAARAKHREHRHHHHNRDWWRHHCDVIALVGWGYWGWDSGWWYPAWGYDPVYSRYDFDEPIYGYDGLPPDQVIANVQGALQRLGYYRNAVDGVLGPTTRIALQNYQRDHGLSATGMIDRQTLASLGFI